MIIIESVMLFDRDNMTVQERLFDRMDDLLELDVAIPEMADVLSEVCCYSYYNT